MPLGERSSESSAADHAAHPLFARFYDRLSARAEDRGQRRHREALLAGLSGRVLEVGAGNGLNFGHYPQSVTEVLAVEPEPFLRARALEAAEHVTVNVHVLAGSAEALPRDDGSCDAAVASLVLCSVADQAAALTEMRRVLRAGGELRFYDTLPPLRAGAAWGLTLERSGDLYGQSVNLASRVCGVAAPGSLAATLELVEAAGPVAEWSSLGDKTLKGIDSPMELFAATAS